MNPEMVSFLPTSLVKIDLAFRTPFNEAHLNSNLINCFQQHSRSVIGHYLKIPHYTH